MKDLVEYIIAILNVTTESALVLQDITTELQKVNDLVAYKDYIRTNIKSVDVDYLTGFQKFIQLTDKYLKNQEDVILEGKYLIAEKFAVILSGKVKQCRNVIEESGTDITLVRLQGENFFTDPERRMLKKIGSTNAVIEFSKINRLSGEIYKEYVKAIQIQHKQKSLPNQNKDVMKLARKALQND